MRKIMSQGILIFILCFINTLWAAEIIHLEGKVEVQRKGEKETQAAKLGMKLNPGDFIWTRGIDSRVDIDLDEKNKGNKVIKVGENTQLILRANMDPRDIDNIDLDFGDIFSKIEKLKGDSTFDVYTLTAVAGVRGTHYGVSTRQDEESEISCYKGKIYVKAFDEQGRLLDEIDVKAGLKTTVKKAQTPSKPSRIGKKETEEWQEWEKEVEEKIEEIKKQEVQEEESKEEKAVPSADDRSLLQQKVKALYEEFKSAYTSGNVNGVLKCISPDWEASGGQSFYDLSDRLTRIFSTFDRLKVEINNLSIQESSNPAYAAQVSYYIKIEGVLVSDPTIKHLDDGQVTEYIKKEGDKYLIAKTVGKGAL